VPRANALSVPCHFSECRLATQETSIVVDGFEVMKQPMTSPHPPEPDATAAVQSLLDHIREGDQSSIQALLAATVDRLRLLAKKIAGNIPSVKQFEQTDDLLQNSLIRLWRAFEKHHPPTPLDYYRLASAIMRRELIDMSRHYFGAEGMGANQVRAVHDSGMPADTPLDSHGDETHEPQKLGRWTEFHEYVERLGDEERTLFDLLWYQGLTLPAAAQIMGSSERTLRRRWKAARLSLYRNLMEP
jgi:RNA polymerase sigma factor (sigma-70 family)